MAKKHTYSSEPDSVFLLKVLLYFFLGTFWVRFESATVSDFSFSLPAGLLLGLFFAHHEHFKIDRKIEYAVLLVSTVISYFLPIGLIV